MFLPYVGKERGRVTTASCNIPHSKAIFIQIDGALSDYSDPIVQPKTMDTLINQVSRSNVYPNPFDITLDGHPLSLTNDEAFKVQSDLFNFTLPPNNLWDEPAGPDQGIGQGWYLFSNHFLRVNMFYIIPRDTGVQVVIQLYHLDKGIIPHIYKT